VNRIPAALLAVLAIALLGGCGKFTVQSPDEQSARERKAAGVSTFQITCSKDIWERTKHLDHNQNEVRARSVTDRRGGMVIVELSGPEMVKYLQQLNGAAHPGSWNADPDQIAVRMYNAISPAVDAVQEGKPAASSVEITLNDAAPGTSTSSTTGTPTPTRTSR